MKPIHALLLLWPVATGIIAAETSPQRDSIATTIAAARKIDVIVAADLRKNSLQVNPPASDETFVRRVHLDLVGRIPTHGETVAFLASTDPDKRAKLIDRLVSSEGFVMHQFQFLADLLRVLSKGTYSGEAGRVTGTSYVEYLKESVRVNKPYDQLVRELVTARGKAWENGAVGYYQRDRAMPLDNLATTIRIFMGTRIECAQCHNHPFDKWTQKQFHEMAAYTYGVQTVMGNYSPSFTGMLTMHTQRHNKEGTSRDEEEHLRKAFNEMIVPIKHAWVSQSPQRLRLPHDYQYPDAKPDSLVQPAVIMGSAAPVSPKDNPLEVFAAWLTSPDNPRFTTAIANRLWKKVFGLGLIEPVDDITDASVAMIPELVEHLRKLMIEQRYDVKAFLRILCNTQIYQREVTRAEVALGETYHFTGPLLRRMSAEQMWDSLTTLVHLEPDLPNLPLREQTETFLANERKLGEGIEHLTSAELLQRADATSEIFREHATSFKGLQQQMVEARERDDKAEVAALARQLGVLRQAEITTAEQNIYIPAIMKLSPQSRQTGTSYKDIQVPGYMPRDRTAEKAAQTQMFMADAARFGFPERLHETYAKFRQTMMRLWPRASEIESPAPPGHPLRDFGQSDRESVDNGSQEASVSQALVLMNGEMMPYILNPWSGLRLTVKQEAYPDDRISAVYLAILSRKPTPAEREQWTKAQAAGLDQIDDLIYALLNTQQFIFIQ